MFCVNPSSDKRGFALYGRFCSGHDTTVLINDVVAVIIRILVVAVRQMYVVVRVYARIVVAQCFSSVSRCDVIAGSGQLYVIVVDVFLLYKGA